MVNIPKANALNKRAMLASQSLDYWAKRLRQEATAQTPVPEKPLSKYMDPELPETITLNRKEIELLIENLHAHARQLRQFTWPAPT